MAVIRVTRVIQASREEIWEALTNPRALSEWMLPNDFSPVVGHRFTFRTSAAPGFDGVIRCEVLELVPPERLKISWVGGPLDTKVTFLLADGRQGVQLTLEHEGFEGLGQALPWLVLGIDGRQLISQNLPAYLRGRRRK
ncbi:MAG: SRPBCC domain-containing protein [Phenylobacterium sp.]